MKKTIVIDGQILQTGAWHRGMGKYTMQVLSELGKHVSDDFEVRLLFNLTLEYDDTRIEEIKRLCPTIRHTYARLPIATNNSEAAPMYRAALEDHLRQLSLDGDKYFLATSLFTFDYFVEFPHGYKSLLIFYDLTPLLFWKDLGGYFPQELYMGRFEKILSADHIFSISETTRQDLLKVFGLSPDRVSNINGGFTKLNLKPKKPVSFKVPKDFILFPSGDLPHKNNDVAVKGFGEYARLVKSTKQLLITSSFSESSIQRLSQLADNVVFTGNVSDEELEWLYENAEAVIFASKYEGLGMPILDAVANDKPIITSRIPVFEEMSKTAFYYFKPDDPEGLAKMIKAAADKKGFVIKAAEYPQIMKKYTWRNTGSGIIAHVCQFTNQDPKDPNAIEGNIAGASRPRLAIASLHPGIADQIGRRAETMYASLRENFEVSFFFDANGHHYREMERPTFLNHMECLVFDINRLDLQSYAQYDAILYLLDKHAIPSRVAQRACVLPGFVVYIENGRETDLTARTFRMLKDLIAKNQITSFTMQKNDYDDFQKIATELKRLIDSREASNSASAVIRQGGSNIAIIRKLLSMEKSND